MARPVTGMAIAFSATAMDSAHGGSLEDAHRLAPRMTRSNPCWTTVDRDIGGVLAAEYRS